MPTDLGKSTRRRSMTRLAPPDFAPPRLPPTPMVVAAPYFSSLYSSYCFGWNRSWSGSLGIQGRQQMLAPWRGTMVGALPPVLNATTKPTHATLAVLTIEALTDPTVAVVPSSMPSVVAVLVTCM